MNKLKTAITILGLSFSLAFSAQASASTIISDKGLAGISTSLDKYIEVEAETNSNIQLLSVKETKKSKYDNFGFSIANDYVNIRSAASTDSKIAGKLYRGNIAKIESYEGDWAKVKSGNVEGYVSTQFLAIGKEAEKLADTFTEQYAVVNTETLRVREEASTESKIITLVPFDEKFYVNKEYDEWVNIMIDGDDSGYVSKAHVKLETKYTYGISIEEEQAKIAAKEAEEKAARAAEEAANKAAQEAANKAAAEKKSVSSSSSNKTAVSAPALSGSSLEKGKQIANYAKQFVGNPYVYGGTSLTSGADCSGFVQSIYRHFGYSITRVSADQARSAGKSIGSITTSNLQPGDLIFYGGGGGINHVALYIGDGKVVHASNARDGIKISSYNYRTPSVARRIL